MSLPATEIYCPGCTKPCRNNQAFFAHIKQSTNALCKQAYRDLLNIHTDDEIEAPLQNFSDASLPEPHNNPDIVMDIPLAASEAGENVHEDFFGSFNDDIDDEDDFDFELNIQDTDLDVGIVPDLEDVSDDEDDEDYIW